MTSLLLSTDELLRGQLAPAGDAARTTRLLPRLLLTLVVFGVLYGATMGTFGGVHGQRALQPVYSGLKVPMLLLVTFAVSLPSFFVLNTILGVREDFGHVMRALVATQAGLTVVLASLAPFTAFWYVSFAGYEAALMFNAAMFAIASFAGQWMLRRVFPPPVARQRRHPPLPPGWLVLFALAGLP